MLFVAEATCVFLEDVSTIQATHSRFNNAVCKWSKKLIGQPMLKNDNYAEYNVDVYCLIASLDFIDTNLEQLQQLGLSRKVIVPLMNIKDYHSSENQIIMERVEICTQ